MRAYALSGERKGHDNIGKEEERGINHLRDHGQKSDGVHRWIEYTDGEKSTWRSQQESKEKGFWGGRARIFCLYTTCYSLINQSNSQITRIRLVPEGFNVAYNLQGVASPVVERQVTQ